MIMGRKDIKAGESYYPQQEVKGQFGRLFFCRGSLNFSFPSFFRATWLWPAALEKSRVQAHISDVIPVQNPAKKSFQAQAIPSMRTGTIFSLICIPVVRSGVNPFPLIAFENLLTVPGTHGASYNLTNVGHQHVHRFSKSRILRTALHVEGLDLHGKAT